MAMSARRPLPALAFLLALSLLTALVWWRVFHRAEDGTPTAAPTCVAQAGVALPAPATITVTVLNGTERVGLAGAAAATLGADGFVLGASGNDPAAVAGVAEIRFGPTGLAGATLMSYYIPGAALVPVPARADATLEVSLGAKFPDTGGVRTVEQATAAITAAAAAPSAAGKPC
jgi:hypothetical protein